MGAGGPWLPLAGGWVRGTGEAPFSSPAPCSLTVLSIKLIRMGHRAPPRVPLAGPRPEAPRGVVQHAICRRCPRHAKGGTPAPDRERCGRPEDTHGHL